MEKESSKRVGGITLGVSNAWRCAIIESYGARDRSKQIRYFLESPTGVQFTSKTKAVTFFESQKAAVDEITCGICGKGDREDRLMLCNNEQCDESAHCFCVGLKSVAKGDWFCNKCNKPVDKTKTARNRSTVVRNIVASSTFASSAASPPAINKTPTKEALQRMSKHSEPIAPNDPYILVWEKCRATGWKRKNAKGDLGDSYNYFLPNARYFKQGAEVGVDYVEGEQGVKEFAKKHWDWKEKLAEKEIDEDEKREVRSKKTKKSGTNSSNPKPKNLSRQQPKSKPAKKVNPYAPQSSLFDLTALSTNIRWETIKGSDIGVGDDWVCMFDKPNSGYKLQTPSGGQFGSKKKAKAYYDYEQELLQVSTKEPKGNRSTVTSSKVASSTVAKVSSPPTMPSSEFSQGDNVSHTEHGPGVITEKANSRGWLKVRFSSGGPSTPCRQKDLVHPGDSDTPARSFDFASLSSRPTFKKILGSTIGVGDDWDCIVDTKRGAYYLQAPTALQFTR